MNQHTWNRARELFETLADRPASEHEAMLAARCATDALLRAQVHGLLLADSAGRHILDGTAFTAYSSLMENPPGDSQDRGSADPSADPS